MAGYPEIRLSARKGRALLAHLAMTPDMHARREQLAGLLWADSTETQGRQSLRQCLIALRKDLGRFSAALLSTTDTIALDTALVCVDALEFEQCASNTDAAAIERALTLYRGPFLKDFDIDLDHSACGSAVSANDLIVC